jgi:hypothetical protein
MQSPSNKKAPGPRPEAVVFVGKEFSSERGFLGRIKVSVKPKEKSAFELAHQR